MWIVRCSEKSEAEMKKIDKNLLILDVRECVRDAGYNCVRMTSHGEDYSRARSLYEDLCGILYNIDENADEYIKSTYQPPA